MGNHPGGHEPGVAHPLPAPDSLVEGDEPEEDGVNEPVEPAPWLPNGFPVAAARRDGATGDPAVPGPSPGSPAGSAGAGSPAYLSSGPFGRGGGYGPEDPYAQPSPGQEGPSVASSSYGFGREDRFGAGAPQEQAGALPPPPPPYQGQLPGQQLPGQPGGDTASFRVPQARPGGAAVSVQRRQANLIVARLEPWSVMKFSFLMSLVAWVVLFVAVTLLYFVLSGLGVFHAVQSTLAGATSSQGSNGFDLGTYVSASKVIGYTMLFGAVNIVLITALSTVGAMIYNLVTHLGSGIEVTLQEGD
jgi:hypothetical protein